MEDYFERVVDRPDRRRLPLVRDGELLPPRPRAARDLRSHHNLAYWLGRDYLGIGIGAVSTIETGAGGTRRGSGAIWKRSPAGTAPERELEELEGGVKARERVMLGLRLDEPLPLAGLRQALDPAGLARVEGLGLAERTDVTLTLTERGRYLGGAVTAELLA